MKFVVVLFLLSCWLPAIALNDIGASARISAEGMMLQSERLKVIAQNIANADITGRTSEESPYTRKVLQVKIVRDESLGADVSRIEKVATDKRPYMLKYDPSHPAANAQGYVKYPNVDPILEMADSKEAQRSFEANMAAFDIARSNRLKLLEALK